MTEEETITQNQKEAEKLLDDIISELDKSARNQYWWGVVLFVFGIYFSLMVFFDIKHSTIDHLNYLISPKADTISAIVKTKPPDDNNANVKKKGSNLLNFLTFSYVQSNQEIIQSNSSSDVTARVAYLVARTAGLSAIISTLFYFMFRIARSFFDQGARTTKRKFAAYYLRYIYKKHTLITEGVKLTEIMSAFETWNKTVESAFSEKTPDNGNKN